ncbi:RNA polymerase sigma-70 factor, ECF subfamily [Lishizhenia tianjinensis]|uniref:RNA polymerase sigma-70 factor, ECF subfamily n=1 Tax=Lishizhenia tianjinensis TaxID=477690 RepID=A0A1I6YSQ6_9FLAO|nr:RNA polymerase sigma factor [Lishizhenia tianjinensis]SFT53467.1 RNA polymerase sigma-70 factor, ECF subfamily [Lishizhenia tianjinensis]
MTRSEYNEVVNEHAGRLYGYVLKYLRVEADSNDIVQDVFEKLWKNRKKIEAVKAKSWMFTTAHNTLINFAKKKGRTVYNSETLPERGVESHSFEAKEIVEKVLELLPPIQKSIVLLRDLEGYNYQEIGDMLSLSDSQVKVYLYRARKKMQKQLKDLTIFQ